MTTKLSFKTPVLDNFTFLEKDYGYSIVTSSEYQIVYENDLVIFSVQYDSARSFEIDVTIKLKKSESNIFRLIDLEGIVSRQSHAWQASEQSSLTASIKQIADFIRNNSVDALEGNELFFKRLLVHSEKEKADYNQELEMQFVRRDLNDLWTNKEYEDIVKLLEPVKDQLSPAELKKLEYAKKMS